MRYGALGPHHREQAPSVAPPWQSVLEVVVEGGVESGSFLVTPAGAQLSKVLQNDAFASEVRKLGYLSFAGTFPVFHPGLERFHLLK